MTETACGPFRCVERMSSPFTSLYGPDLRIPALALPPLRQALTLAGLLAAQDAYHQGHGRRVAAYAERLGRRLGLADAEVEILRLAGRLHDIGKIAFSRDLLCNRRRRLSAAMLEEIRRHPVWGGELLRAIEVAAPVVDGVRFHHERRDGSGYPYGLHGEEIPQTAAVIGIADCFDALTTDRSYQKARSVDQALAILAGFAGRSFDPRLVEAFTREIRDHGPAAG